ncbi:unnamed protein product [Sphenostylis stenocarpa]|uniref:Uncharacterized protein n=1 Tax=Sphenostylis stenocarpa TaxID=92480 RepID=A0AA86T7R8_9FABA|nr:unnamed protein product [Sphenostylis stenocarpa]
MEKVEPEAKNRRGKVLERKSVRVAVRKGGARVHVAKMTCKSSEKTKMKDSCI